MRTVRLIKPSSTLGGRQFSPVAELTLHSQIDSVAGSLPGPSGDVLVIPEMPSPLGLPDFAALVGGWEWLRSRSAANVGPILAEADCAVLACLSSRRALALGSVAKRLGWPEDRLKPFITRLERRGAIDRSAGGSLLVREGMSPSGTLFAIETKLKDWPRAVQQGRAYRTWANNYVVVLGQVGPVATGRARDQVMADGAGLHVGGRWLSRPRARTVGPLRRWLGFEYLYAAAGSDPSLFAHD